MGYNSKQDRASKVQRTSYPELPPCCVRKDQQRQLIRQGVITYNTGRDETISFGALQPVITEALDR